ncbi:MAG: A/G-specific adenine glycosylase [Capsulimonadaceae bacterium]|nr:A/G-specific adenine glycosylase [Capsulimonadaceae bacterium]
MTPNLALLPSSSWTRLLLDWFAVNARRLPWRDRKGDAYAVWISEIMLQQTTVAAVVPYFERWMASFPNVHALADASLDDVLVHWAGLGYYARARNIKRAADLIVSKYDGRLPSSVEELLTLPGIGRYTAGAIASIAYDVDAPVVDGNVARVLSRLYGLDGDIDSPLVRADLWRLSEGAIPQGRAGDFNQSMMELGALVCSPASPACPICPLQMPCAAHASGDPTALPVRLRKTHWVQVVDCAALLEVERRILLIRRPDSGVWGGLWELPRATLAEGETRKACASRACSERAGLVATIGDLFGEIRHTVMNRRITLAGFAASADHEALKLLARRTDVVLAKPSELADLALASPQRALLNTRLDQGLFA